jgi:ribosomal protein S18 acetylase RimI-like enzyme
VTRRPAGPEDAASMAHILVRTWRERYRGLVAQEVLDGLDEHGFATYFEERLAPGTGHGATIASVDGQAAGFIHFGPDEEDSTRGHVFSFYVLPSLSGRGVGRQLLADARAQLVARGYRTVTLWVFKDNEPTVRLYGRAGFVPDGAERVEREYGLVEQRMALDFEAPGA